MPIDPLRLADSQSIEGAALYAKRVASDLADLYPVLVDAAGNLCVNMTVGTVSLSSTASTITNAVGNPVNVSLTSTVVTVANTAGTVTNSVSTIMILNKSLSQSSGTVTATQVTLVLAGSNKTKVYAFSMTTTSTTGVICAFHHGSQAGPELWRVLLQAPSGANSGANLAVSPPAHIFATPSAGNLILFLSASVRVDFSVAWFDEA